MAEKLLNKEKSTIKTTICSILNSFVHDVKILTLCSSNFMQLDPRSWSGALLLRSMDWYQGVNIWWPLIEEELRVY